MTITKTIGAGGAPAVTVERIDRAMTRLLTVKEAAVYLRCGVSTLNKLRVTGGGPMYVKTIGRVLYKLDDLDRHIEKHRIRSTAQNKRAA